jgi:hypothetical protein
MDIVTETQNLLQHCQPGNAFRKYLDARLRLVVPVLVIFLAFSIATTAGTVIFLGGTRSFLVLVALITAPFVLLGNLYVQAFTFFLWLENHAIDRATHRRPRTEKEELAATLSGLCRTVKGFPLVVQVVGAAIVLVPLLFLAALSGTIAFLLLALLLATPFAFSLLDR